MTNQDKAFPWALGVFDAHCHPTDTMSNISCITSMKTRVLTVMATRAEDQSLVSSVADIFGLKVSQSPLQDQWIEAPKVIPSFGWHPWFSYQLFDELEYDGANALNDEQRILHFQRILVPSSEDTEFLLNLPNPRPLSRFLEETRKLLARYPLALIGEVGLDKSFRIPVFRSTGLESTKDSSFTVDGHPRRQWSPYRVSMAHQRKLLKAQLQIAGEMRRAASIHGSQCHGMLFETLCEMWEGYEREVLSSRDRKKLKSAAQHNADAHGPIDDETKPYPPRICLHSFSGPVDQVKQYLNVSVPVEIFFSFSEVINFSKGNSKAAEVIKMLPDDKILVESDLHMAGTNMDECLEAIVRRICEIKGWELKYGVQRLGRNWKKFIFGSEILE
ncbi:uncharacterized protein PV09_08272 [Verruconis gallopava]|uniref:Metallo-dependent hydrolase n=1 Tax=Verruconis gallopava TaxID=253628 RepID=A0A0D1XCY4_9PEZI|nr:uncharacterized protein PV09_08272 [Verruconis gallopava]KIW00086.1 hypothetical protein PV09_08272 [Verruconis gallopava]